MGRTKGTILSVSFYKRVDGDPRDMLFRHVFLDTAKLADIVLAS